MSDSLRVAVTGVGGGVGQSIMKALSIASLAVEIYPVDIHPYSAGLYRGKKATILPPPEDERDLTSWKEWALEQEIVAILPGSDHDLLSFASVRDAWRSEGICEVLVSDVELVRIGQDKALTVECLKQEGVPVPDSLWGVDLEQACEWAGRIGYPVVLKPREGFASHDVHVIEDEETLRFYFSRVSRPILQEYLSLDGDVEEYTCAVFGNREGQPVGTFMARRDLSGGATYRAEVGIWPDIQDLLRQIGRLLRPRGPLNVQLRRTSEGPVPFELNIRCSGTAAIRAHFGYNEPEMLLRHFVLGEEIEMPTPRKGYVLRYWNEVFLDGIDRAGLSKGRADLKGTVRAWP